MLILDILKKIKTKLGINGTRSHFLTLKIPMHAEKTSIKLQKQTLLSIACELSALF